MYVRGKYGKTTITPYTSNFEHLTLEELLQNLWDMIKISHSYKVETTQKECWQLTGSIPHWKEFRVFGLARKTGRKIGICANGKEYWIDWGKYNAHEFCDAMLTHLTKKTLDKMGDIVKQKHPEVDWDIQYSRIHTR